MAIKMRQPFTPGGKFVASRTFHFGGRTYEPGDGFPWRQLSCSVRRLRTLYEGRYLNNVYFDEETAVEMVSQLTGVLDTGGGGGVDETPTIFNPEIHEITNPSQGQWYIVDESGKQLARLSGREAKRLRKATAPEEIDQTAIKE